MKIPFVKERYFNKRYLGSKLYLRNLEGYVYFAAIELGDDPYNFLAVFDSSTCNKTQGHDGYWDELKANDGSYLCYKNNLWVYEKSYYSWYYDYDDIYFIDFSNLDKQLELFL